MFSDKLLPFLTNFFLQDGAQSAARDIVSLSRASAPLRKAAVNRLALSVADSDRGEMRRIVEQDSNIMPFRNYSDLYGSLYDVSKKICSSTSTCTSTLNQGLF